jgi:hypothetical protein
MTAETINEMMKTIAANYRYTYKDCTDDTMQRMMVSWFESLREYTDEEGVKAFRVCLMKCKQPPTIADLVEKIEKARDLKRPSKSEVWESVLLAVNETKKQVFTEQYGWRPIFELKNEECKKIFSSLPQSVKKWLGFDAFCSYGDMSATSLNVERSRFMKEIDGIRETIREQRQIAMNELLLIGGKK